MTQECNRSCVGCCNKDWDLDALPKCYNYAGYDEILITGGEPMLYPERVKKIVKEIRAENSTAKIYMYTAQSIDWSTFIELLTVLDGITLTLHTQADVVPFLRLNEQLNTRWPITITKSLRLNVFDGIFYADRHIVFWNIKDGIEWIKDRPLPTDEVFMQYNQGEKNEV
jgi:pyruvate-formate lyase-activating enzyme